MKKLLNIIGLILAFATLQAQEMPLLCSVPDLDFAHFERNHLIFPGNNATMERFFKKMDSVVFFGEGNVNIMHIGGSHVQAGTFTQQFRDNLLNINTNLIGGQYFIFPFSVGKTNNPSHYLTSSTGEWTYCRNAVRRDTDKRMGLAGAALTTSDPEATISIVTRAKNSSDITPEFNFNKVTVLGFSETENVVPNVSFDDSIIQGKYNDYQSSYTFNLPDFTDSICIVFPSIEGEFTLTGVLLENGMPGISVHGIGVNGASVPSYLRCDDFERDLELVRPDLIIFSIGINDAAEANFDKETFKRNYGELISIMQRVNPDCALLFVTNNDSYKRIKVKKKKHYEVNPNGAIVEKTFLEMGKRYNAAVWDQFDIMGGLYSMQNWEKAGLAQPDKVHFTKSGYQLMGDLLYNALIESYMEHVKRNAKR